MPNLTLEEQQSKVKNTKTFENTVVVANIVELVASVISRVNGKDIAYSNGKDNLSRSVLNNLVASRLKNKLVGNSNVK